VTFAFVAVTIVVMLGMASLTVDVGMMYRARAEAQAAADSAALAGAWKLLDRGDLAGAPDSTDEIANARTSSVLLASRNDVVNDSVSVDGNTDVTIGYLADHTVPGAPMVFGTPNTYNTVQVIVHRDEVRNGPIDLFFAGVFGQTTADIQAEAWATFKDGVVGYRPNERTGNSELIPLALHVDAWNNLLAGTFTTGDSWSYNEGTGAVSAGADGIRELNLYPGGGVNQLPPGNFGTVDFGGADNSTADLARQIVYGVSADDLAELGGELVLGADGTLPLNGDTGLSASIQNELISIIGLPRAIPLFNSVAGPGNNSVFTIVGFAGIRILDVRLTGAMSQKRVIIQPAFVVDDSAVTGSGSQNSSFVYTPVQLVR
jgi:hypothetical protein